jgi:hypothetical protein
VSSALERWRERCNLAKSTGDGLPESGLKLAACRQGLWEALSLAASTNNVSAVIDGLEKSLAKAMSVSGVTVSGRTRHGLRLALRWLREEIEKGEG